MYRKRVNFWVRQSILKLLIVLIFVLLSSAGLAARKFETGDSPDKFTEYLDRRIVGLMKTYDIPGVSIVLIQDGEITWSEAYGYADLEQKIPMRLETVCRSQSISKSVTAWGVMKLVEQGKIGLDDPVIKYIKNWSFPDTEFSEESLTVRQLLSQNSGMPLGTIGVHYPPQSENIPTLMENLSSQAHLINEPGSGFLYSNVNFNLLELLIEEVTGESFENYMQQEVLKPLGMRNSTYTWNENLNPSDPVGYDLKGNPVKMYVYPEKGSGGLLADVEDIARFVSAGMTGRYYRSGDVLELASVEKLYSREVELSDIYSNIAGSYGLGHFVESLSDDKYAISHGGQGHGWMTHFHSVPEEGEGIVILTNSQRSWPFISYILNDWSEWIGVSSVGMSKISKGVTIIWLLIVVVLLVSFWQMVRLIRGVVLKRRNFAPLSTESRLLRSIQADLFVVAVLVFVWSINQTYLFLPSVFPVAYNWLWVAGFALTGVSLLSALFPRVARAKA